MHRGVTSEVKSELPVLCFCGSKYNAGACWAEGAPAGQPSCTSLLFPTIKPLWVVAWRGPAGDPASFLFLLGREGRGLTWPLPCLPLSGEGSRLRLCWPQQGTLCSRPHLAQTGPLTPRAPGGVMLAEASAPPWMSFLWAWLWGSPGGALTHSRGSANVGWRRGEERGRLLTPQPPRVPLRLPGEAEAQTSCRDAGPICMMLDTKTPCFSGRRPRSFVQLSQRSRRPLAASVRHVDRWMERSGTEE